MFFNNGIIDIHWNYCSVAVNVTALCKPELRLKLHSEIFHQLESHSPITEDKNEMLKTLDWISV